MVLEPQDCKESSCSKLLLSSLDLLYCKYNIMYNTHSYVCDLSSIRNCLNYYEFNLNLTNSYKVVFFHSCHHLSNSNNKFVCCIYFRIYFRQLFLQGFPIFQLKNKNMFLCFKTGLRLTKLFLDFSL